MKFAVLQSILEQTIPLPVLEEAVRAAETLARPDCRLLQRELFGIIAGNLGRDEALGMRRFSAGMASRPKWSRPARFRNYRRRNERRRLR